MPGKGILFKILGVIAGLVFMVSGAMERSDIKHTKAVGKTAYVDPIEKYTERTSKGSKTYDADFTFTTEKGDKISAHKSFPAELVNDFKSGKPVKIFYDPGKPSDFIFEKEEPSWFMVITGLGLAIAAVLFA